MTADQATLVKGGVSRLRGHVRVRRGTEQLDSSKGDYDQPRRVIGAEGSVRYWNDGLYLTGDRATMNLDSNVTTIEHAGYVFQDRHGHGDAEHVTLTGRDLMQIRKATYTTCDPGHVDWLLKARRLKLDKVADVGTARDVVVDFMNVPIFYSPYLTFPLSNKRKSGFLTPSVGFTKETGAEISAPWYWNIAPDMDATFTPRIMSARGVLLGGEYRYLTREEHGEAAVEYMPYDTQSHEARGLFRLQHTGTYDSRWHTVIDATEVTDSNYFSDLGTNLDIASTQYLDRRADVTYYGNRWSLFGRVQSYQTVDDSIPDISRPYARAPQLVFNTSFPERNQRFDFGARAEYVNFERGAGVTGSRIDLGPYVTYPVRTAAAFFVPRLTLRHTFYALDHTAPGADGTPSRTLPIFSADSGLFFDRQFHLHGDAYTQTLEPRLYYLYVPYENQNDLPVFDSGLYTFSFAQLFRDDRFAGADRVGDANQLTLALTSRVLASNTGDELVRASVGQIRYFRRRRVTLPGGTPDASGGSALVADAAAHLTNGWQVSGGLQWDPNNNRTDKAAVSLRYSPAPDRVVNLAYRFVRQTFVPQEVNQTDLSFRWPVNDRVGIVGRWNYAIDTARTLESFGGVEYESCCWAARAVVRRYVNDTAGNVTTGFFLQLELKGLSGIGRAAGTFLERSIPGYKNQF